jgi:alkylation response protein AidB-like acyl-CoA dehydrogenase
MHPGLPVPVRGSLGPRGGIRPLPGEPPEAGSDVSALATTATMDGPAHMRLDGLKTWISNGGIADHYVVFARTGEAPGTMGLSAFVVDADAPGLSIADRIAVIAPHPLATLRFDGCRVPVANRLGAPGEGFKVAMATLDIFRSTVAAATLGFARRALDEALYRSATRKLCGAPLADLQMTQAALADSGIEIDAAALLIYRAAWAKDQGVARAASDATPKFVSPSDPAAQWTGALRNAAFFAYADNYLIDVKFGIIMDVEALSLDMVFEGLFPFSDHDIR